MILAFSYVTQRFELLNEQFTNTCILIIETLPPTYGTAKIEATILRGQIENWFLLGWILRE